MKTILQAFEWYLPADSQHWKNITNLIPDLHKLGITGLWLPPASKAASGVEDVGYGTYDLFDLGEFDQKAPCQQSMEQKMIISNSSINSMNMKLRLMQILFLTI